ncbi:SPOR domain-containing protein [Labilibacter sediminis]|nr:SPOR domain-containing protein [Labilibacter sediminis]
MRIVLFIVVCFMAVYLNGQNKTGQQFFEELSYSKGDSGRVNVIQDPELENMVGVHIDMNKRNGGIDGFRIQLYLGSSNNAKNEATEVKKKLLSLFSDEKIYVMYEAPFWRVQVGDFRSKNEALELYRSLKKEFPSCYPVPVNNISLSNLQ